MTSSARVAARYVEKTAMAVIFQNVGKHDWGFFSREDKRMHLQTVDAKSSVGRNKTKVWLEERGKRTFELALGSLDGKQLKALERERKTEQEYLETKWIQLMLSKDWLTAKLTGSTITLTAYPGDHNSFHRKIDLRKEYPGQYKKAKPWEGKSVLVSFHGAGLLAVGPDEEPNERHHLPIVDFLFVD
jgi:hypothetical protein